jgi:hypothetical protein
MQEKAILEAFAEEEPPSVKSPTAVKYDVLRDVSIHLSEKFLDMFEGMYFEDVRTGLSGGRHEITTMTFSGKMGTQPEQAVLHSIMEDVDNGTAAMGLHGEGGHKKRRRLLGNSTFSNAITLNCENCPASIKVWPNGSFKVAGCRHFSDLEKLITTSHMAIAKRHFELLGTSFPMTIESLELSMINVHFLVSANVKLRLFYEHMTPVCTALGGRCVFPENGYSGVKVYDAEKTFASLFRTGRGIIVARSPLLVLTMYRLIFGAVEKHRNDIVDATSKYVPWTDWPAQAQCLPGLMHTHPPVRFVVDACPYCQRGGNCIAFSKKTN